MNPPIAKLNSPAISNSFESKLQAGISEVMRLTATSDNINFLAGTGCTRPRPLSPRFGGSSPLVPMAVAAAVGAVVAGDVTGAVFLAESVAGAGVEGVAGALEVCSVVSAWAIGASTSAVTFSASAAAIASWQDTVASQWPRFTSLAVWLTWQQYLLSSISRANGHWEQVKDAGAEVSIVVAVAVSVKIMGVLLGANSAGLGRPNFRPAVVFLGMLPS